jgi:hypothetical protein
MKPVLTTKDDVLRKCAYFIDVQLWPLKNRVNPDGWLKNFTADELQYATMLLNGFFYLSEGVVDAVYRSAFRDLVTFLRDPSDTAFAVETKWRVFKERLLLTYCTGEDPNPTDSGLLFARKARQILNIPEERIVTPTVALERMATEGRPVAFVDDFVGSGAQFLQTWHRRTKAGPLAGHSFASFASINPPVQAFYCPLVATSTGMKAIKDTCQGAVVSPAHVLNSRYSAIDPDSLIWPSELQLGAYKFLREASIRAGIPEDVSRTDDWRGFHQLGLTLAFFHSVPDATLPLFYWEQNGWTPLIRRT